MRDLEKQVFKRFLEKMIMGMIMYNWYRETAIDDRSKAKLEM